MHDFHEAITKAGPHSAWCGGKTVHHIEENGYEFRFCFTDGTVARFEIVGDEGQPLKGKLRCKSLGIHITAKTARLGR